MARSSVMGDDSDRRPTYFRSTWNEICGYCYLVTSECRAECSVFDFGRFALNRPQAIPIEYRPNSSRQLLRILPLLSY